MCRAQWYHRIRLLLPPWRSPKHMLDLAYIHSLFSSCYLTALISPLNINSGESRLAAKNFFQRNFELVTYFASFLILWALRRTGSHFWHIRDTWVAFAAASIKPRTQPYCLFLSRSLFLSLSLCYIYIYPVASVHGPAFFSATIALHKAMKWKNDVRFCASRPLHRSGTSLNQRLQWKSACVSHRWLLPRRTTEHTVPSLRGRKVRACVFVRCERT